MNRRTIGTLCGLGIGIVVACQGGGSPNDFGLGPSDNAPTDPGAPADPNAPPGNPNDPPFSDGTVPGTAPDCGSVCREFAAACADDGDDADDIADIYDDCFQDCSEFPTQCRSQSIAVTLCTARNDCDIDIEPCQAELAAFINCVGPMPPDGEGGRGGI